MPRYTKLRISFNCEAGMRYAGATLINYHEQCTGMEDRRVGRNFKCQCACHRKPTPKPVAAPTWTGNPSAIAPGSERHTEKLPGAE